MPNNSAQNAPRRTLTKDLVQHSQHSQGSRHRARAAQPPGSGVARPHRAVPGMQWQQQRLADIAERTAASAQLPPRTSALRETSPSSGRLIQASCDAGLTVVRLNPKESEQGLWNILGVPTFRHAIGPEELLEELAWQRAGRPEPAALQTPWAATDLVWEHTSSTPAEVAICISSYNYADRITAALESWPRAITASPRTGDRR